MRRRLYRDERRMIFNIGGPTCQGPPRSPPWQGARNPRNRRTGRAQFLFDPCNTPTDGKTIAALQSEGWITTDGALALEHDAAHVHCGGDWRMPTKQELDDLSGKCDWTWSTQGGVSGFIVSGKGVYASNSIFLPASGIGWENSLEYDGSYGYIWLSSLGSTSSNAWDLYFHASFYNTSYDYRYRGRSVRPVQGDSE